MIATCIACGKLFKTHPCNIKQGGGKLCSRKCYGVWKSKNIVGKNHPNWKGGHRGKIIQKCLICGNDFRADPWKIKIGRGELCSLKCRGKWHSNNVRGSKTYNWKGGPIKKVCEICGKLFIVSRWRNKRSGCRFCSRVCFGKTMHGGNNPSWRGGVNPIDLSIRNSSQYLKWRSGIFKRDGFTCQKCGDDTSGNLQAHHKKRFIVILNDIKQKFPLLSILDIAVNYSALWDINNGITLCIPCHKKEHKK